MRNPSPSILILIFIGLFYSCRKDNTPAPQQTTTGHQPITSVQIGLSGQVWECYQYCDSILNDTLSRSDTLRFATQTDDYSWDSLAGHYTIIYPIADTAHTRFDLTNTDFGQIETFTPLSGFSQGLIAGAHFRNTTTNEVTYLWLRKIH